MAALRNAMQELETNVTYHLYRDTIEERIHRCPADLDELVEWHNEQTWRYPEVVAKFSSEEEALTELKNYRCSARLRGRFCECEMFYVEAAEWDGEDFIQSVCEWWADYDAEV